MFPQQSIFHKLLFPSLLLLFLRSFITATSLFYFYFTTLLYFLLYFFATPKLLTGVSNSLISGVTPIYLVLYFPQQFIFFELGDNVSIDMYSPTPFFVFYSGDSG